MGTQQNMLSITSELTATSTVSSEEASSAIDGFSAAINSKSDELVQHMVQNNNMAVTSVGPVIIIISSPSLSLKPSFIPSSSPSLKPSSISSSSPSLKPSSNFPSYVPSITAIPSEPKTFAPSSALSLDFLDMDTAYPSALIFSTKKPKNVNKAKPKKENKKKKSKKPKKENKKEKSKKPKKENKKKKSKKIKESVRKKEKKEKNTKKKKKKKKKK